MSFKVSIQLRYCSLVDFLANTRKSSVGHAATRAPIHTGNAGLSVPLPGTPLSVWRLSLLAPVVDRCVFHFQNCKISKTANEGFRNKDEFLKSNKSSTLVTTNATKQSTWHLRCASRAWVCGLRDPNNAPAHLDPTIVSFPFSPIASPMSGFSVLPDCVGFSTVAQYLRIPLLCSPGV